MPSRSTDNAHTAINRRQLVAGLGAGAVLSLPAPAAGAAARPADLADAAVNLAAYIRLRSDLSGAVTLSGAPGEAWAWVPGEGAQLLFRTWTVGVSRAVALDSGWRLDHHEMTWYLDARTGRILEEWENPLTGELVRVRSGLDQAPSRHFALVDGPLPWELHGDDLVFSSSEFHDAPAVLTRAAFPREAQSDRRQAGDLRGLVGRCADALNPALDSAACVTSWSRIAQWLPFMEMGNRPGVLIQHAHLHKLMDGVAGLPAALREHAERHHPELLAAPAATAAFIDGQANALMADAGSAQRGSG
jgi:hypothetical protein